MFSETVAQLTIFILKPRQPEGVFDGDKKFVSRRRLLEKIQRTQLGGADSHFNVGLTGNEDDRRF